MVAPFSHHSLIQATHSARLIVAPLQAEGAARADKVAAYMRNFAFKLLIGVAAEARRQS